MDDEDYIYTCASIPIIKSGTKLEFESGWATSDDNGTNYMQYGTHAVAIDASKFSSISAGQELCVYVNGGCNFMLYGGELTDSPNDDNKIYAAWADAGIYYFTLTEAQVTGLKNNGLYAVYNASQDGSVKRTIDIMLVQ